MRAANPTKEVRHIGMMGEELAAYLHTLRMSEHTKAHFIAIERAIHSIIPTIDKIETGIDKKSGEVELSVTENNVTIPSRLLSEGTLRILGLLSVSGGEDSPSVICFEEPENGVHPQRIAMVAEYLKNASQDNSQIIVITHSPILIDLIDDESLYACKKKDGKTFIDQWIDQKLPCKSGLDEEYPLPSERILRGDMEA